MNRWPYLLAVCLLLLRVDAARAQTFDWAKAFTGADTTYTATATGVAYDAAGNLYVSGSFIERIQLSPTVTLTNADSITSGYLAKFDPAGNILWTKQFNGRFYDGATVTDVQTDAQGNAYITGSFARRMNLGIGGPTLTCDSAHVDYFVAKFSPGGTLLMHYNAGNQGNRRARKLTVDRDGNAFITGLLYSRDHQGIFIGNTFIGNHQTGRLDSIPIFNGTFVSWFPVDQIFVHRINADGTPGWVARHHISGFNGNWAFAEPNDIAVDRAGGVYVTGWTSGVAMDFKNGGGTIPGGTTATDRASFVAKFDAATGGPPAASAGGVGFMIPGGFAGGHGVDVQPYIAVDSLSNLYLGTKFTGGVNVGGANLTGPFLAVGPWRNHDSYIAKYNSALQLQWVRQLGDSSLLASDADVRNVAIDPQGRVVAVCEGYLGRLGTPDPWRSPAYVLSFDGRGDYASGLYFSGSQRTQVWQYFPYVTSLAAGPGGRFAIGGQFLDSVYFTRSYTLGGHLRQARAFVAAGNMQFNTVRGLAFIDTNTDGVRTPGEGPFRGGAMVRVTPLVAATPRYAWTDTTGHYSVSTGLGTFTAALMPPPYYQTTGGAGAPAVFATYGNDEVRNLGLKPIPGQQDVRVHVTPVGRARPGFLVKYRVTYHNVGTVNVNGAVVLTADARLQYLSTTGTGTLANGTLTTSYTQLRPGQTRAFDVLYQLPTTAPLGDTLVCTSAITPLAGDLVPADNLATSRLVITGSFDPNELHVNFTSLTTQQVANGEWLEYTIWFQNMGTDTAFTVTLRDTLPDQLDLATFDPLAASHPSDWTVGTNRVLTIRFDSIDLPNRAVNTAGSLGVVCFRVKPLSTLVGGDMIHNQVDIHFDYNAPITTNAALTTVGQPTGLPGSAAVGLPAAVWPNPVTDRLHVETSLPLAVPLKLTLLDAMGRPVRQLALPAASGRIRADLDLRGVTAGLYLLRAEAGTGGFTRRVVVR